jgi:hypothetical protein
MRLANRMTFSSPSVWIECLPRSHCPSVVQCWKSAEVPSSILELYYRACSRPLLVPQHVIIEEARIGIHVTHYRTLPPSKSHSAVDRGPTSLKPYPQALTSASGSRLLPVRPINSFPSDIGHAFFNHQHGGLLLSCIYLTLLVELHTKSSG